MCGRFTLTNPGALERTFGQFRFDEFRETRLPRFNVAPTQDVLGVRNDGRNAVEELRWGIRGRINVRAESIAARRYPVRRRCIEFADGFYEWRDRRPFYFTLFSGEPFAFAGLWEPGNGLPACDVATCEPNALVGARARSNAGHPHGRGARSLARSRAAPSRGRGLVAAALPRKAHVRPRGLAEGE